ncbi:MAG: fibronectin type III domain-containing protein [Chloroflexi bacterium]|nr:fibronectin type III domain-containing protein [Chloroflexota bacterium]
MYLEEKARTSPPSSLHRLGVAVLVAALFTVGLITSARSWATSPTAWTDFQPMDWITALPVTVSVRAENPMGFDNHVAYQLTTDKGLTWTDWLTQPVRVAQPISTQLHITVTLHTLSDGRDNNRIRFRVRTGDGQEDISPEYLLQVDTQPPTVTITAPEKGEVLEQVHIRGTADDIASGVMSVSVRLEDEKGRFWNGTTWTPDETWVPVMGLTEWTYLVLSPWDDGEYTLWARAEDRVGHRAETGPVPFYLDTSPPPPPRNVHIEPETWTRDNHFAIQWENPEDPAGIVGVRYTVGQPPLTPEDGTLVEGEDIHHLSDIAVPEEGEWPIYLWLVDGLGHSDPSQHARVIARYDATPPGAPFALQAEPEGWQKENDFTLSWMNPVDLSGIQAAYYRLDREPTGPTDGIRVEGEDITRISHIQLPREGVFDVYLWLEDRAGNVDHRRRNVLLRAFHLDMTPPTLTLHVTGTWGLNQWYTTPVTVQLHAQDGLSGIADVGYQLDNHPWQEGTLLHLTRSGIHHLRAQAHDLAGNASALITRTFRVDTIPPVITYTLPSLPAGQTWYRTPVDIRVHAQDRPSGIQRVEYRIGDGEWRAVGDTGRIHMDRDGRHRVWIRATDRAGNRHIVGPILVPVDLTPPITAYVISGQTGEGNWYISPITVTLTPTDTASGVTATYYRIDGGDWQEGTQFTIEEDGKHTIEFYSIDAAGWKEQGFPTPVWVDTTPPPAPPYLWAEPNQWTSQNDFTVRWATPSDLSQVVGAYYTLDRPPTSPTDGTYVPGGHAIHHVQVPDEGAHTIYVWLRDGAGNASIDRVTVLEQGLKYDATPPTTTSHIQGKAGMAEWWRSPVTITLTVSDVLSGPRATYLALDGGPWVQRRRLHIAADGKHQLLYYSVDRAGNREEQHHQTIRIDTQPPVTPEDLRLVTRGWQHQNHFLVRWTPPLDLSGIGGIRYTINRPPEGPDDGTFSPGRTSAVIRAPNEGVFDVYIWLVDGAGNSDPATAKFFPNALWYDNTPPRMDVRLEGRQGEEPWYTTPVTIHVSAEDDASGDVTTWLQINQSQPITLTNTFTLQHDGTYHVRIWAVDAAGNRTDTWEQDIHLDLSPPSARIHPLPVYMTGYTPLQGGLVKFTVSWGGEDGQGSGIRSYDIQVKEGIRARWTTWLGQTSETSGTFIGEVGHTYFFRIRAQDKAGHVQPFTTNPRGDAYTHLESIRNGDFELGNLLYWQAARVPQPGEGGRGLKITVKDAESYTGHPSLAVWEGDPEYGGAENPGMVPIGGAVISQTITVPPANQMAHPTLELWYHMITWDVKYAPSHQRWQDTFEIALYDLDRNRLALLLRDGYEAQNIPPKKGVDYAVKHDLGWRRFRYDLSRYAGRTIILELSTWNRWDNQYNTYTILDDIRIVDPELTPKQHLPMIWGAGTRTITRTDTAEPSSPEPNETLER